MLVDCIIANEERKCKLRRVESGLMLSTQYIGSWVDGRDVPIMRYRLRGSEKDVKTKGEGGEHTSRANSRYPIHKTHMYRYHIMRRVRRWFSM